MDVKGEEPKVDAKIISIIKCEEILEVIRDLKMLFQSQMKISGVFEIIGNNNGLLFKVEKDYEKGLIGYESFIPKVKMISYSLLKNPVINKCEAFAFWDFIKVLDAKDVITFKIGGGKDLAFEAVSNRHNVKIFGWFMPYV